MIDLHTHFLPGWDDGAPDEQTAFEMLALAAETGTREIVATPRTDLSMPFDEAAADAQVAALQERLDGRIHLHRGALVTLTWKNLTAAVEQSPRLSINGRRYVMVEFSDEVLVSGAGKLVQRFREAGVTPIISGVERKPSLRRDRRRLRSWIRSGALIELSAAALLGRLGERAERAAARLIDAEMAHFVSSAGRNTTHRPPRLDEAYDFIAYRWGDARAERLCIDNPWAVLWGQKVERPRPRSLHRFSFRRFLGIDFLFESKTKKKSKGRRRRRRRRAGS